jgi:hypothetical protein
MEILGVCQSKAYSIIRKLNQELASQGILKESLISGRVSEKYFYERCFKSEPPKKRPKPKPDNVVSITKDAS